MRMLTIEEIKNSYFADDLKHWQAPKLDEIDWESQDFLSWPHPEAGNYFVCVDTPQGPIGFIMEMNSGVGVTSNSCGICFSSNQQMGVKAGWATTGTNPKRKIGLHACADLACSQRIRGELPALFPYETVTAGRRIERLQIKIVNFAQKLRQGT